MRTKSTVLRDFCAEAEELLEAFWDGIDHLEADASRAEARPPKLHALFRHAHSLKGLAGMSDLKGLSAAAHQLEDSLDGLRLGKQAWNPEICSWLREACRAIQAEVRQLAEGKSPSPDPLVGVCPPEVGQAANEPAQVPAEQSVPPAVDEASLRSVLSQYEESRLDFHLRRQTPLSRVRACWSLEEMSSGLQDLLGRLEPAGEVIASVPERTTADGAEFVILIAGDPEAVRQASGNVGRVQPLIQPAAVPPPAEEDLGHTVRVDIERLDPVLSRAGELALDARRLEQLLLGTPGAIETSIDLKNASRLAERLAHAMSQFHTSLVELRMIPIRRLASRLDRTVRDLTRRTGKKIEFRCLGVGTEVDKRVADTLLAPLLHLVRNAVDHGIEPPAERLAAGKPEHGTITLEAWPRGHNVTLRIVDDGRGLDLQKLSEAAVRHGLKPDSDPRHLNELIFHPGLSTASKVSETSGRGVGLDEVRERVLALKGVLRVHSTPGQGVTFELVVPATLAVVPAFLVRTAGAVIGLPLDSVLESRVLKGEDLSALKRDRFLLRGSAALPVFDLGDLLGFRTSGEGRQARQPLVVARGPEGAIGLEVDALLGHREVMMRPLPQRFGSHPAVHGAAELEGDRVALMLDVARLIREEAPA
ncbi:MAG: chemotaxis protein CheA [Acidobacteria bacterium]|nr:chemotaxis protein CheA [Acidobacteriota bacterium]